MPQCVSEMVQVSNFYLQRGAAKILNKALLKFGRKPIMRIYIFYNSCQWSNLHSLSVYHTRSEEIMCFEKEQKLRFLVFIAQHHYLPANHHASYL